MKNFVIAENFYNCYKFYKHLRSQNKIFLVTFIHNGDNIKIQYSKDKYLITYGFHPAESFSYMVGKRLEKNPPRNSDVIYFRPLNIDSSYLELNQNERANQSHMGSKELRQHALELYQKLPFIISLHDTPLYADYGGNEWDEKYEISYPIFNSKLGKILEKFKRNYTDSVHIRYHEMKLSPGYHSAIIEYYPVNFRKNGKFELMSLSKAERFVRDFTVFLQKENQY